GAIAQTGAALKGQRLFGAAIVGALVVVISHASYRLSSCSAGKSTPDAAMRSVCLASVGQCIGPISWPSPPPIGLPPQSSGQHVSHFPPQVPNPFQHFGVIRSAARRDPKSLARAAHN